ncbi:ABC transporter ATP-binding protein [Natronosporangium hydrolyticum]|uniref:ABC transporter ATP-binding protein n=1 Tax=Natronosporangium hydrolyticum TaxID=2811111 RepID=A0A895YM90_9ACTN|nr:ABC transporter ATP-binding protein [Natronosporangium hydrolyticum]QSB15008.1 ABC transporter ATP-binding protein [Natronosporangium hydrolyticum]
MSQTTQTAPVPAVEVHQLRRVYGGRRRAPEVVALDGVDLTVPAGEVHGLLGPNGAGKTTLCKILSTVLLPTAGEAAVLGHDVVRQTGAVRRRIGIVFGGERGLYSRLTPRQNLQFWASLYGLRGRELRDRVDTLLERVGLAERAGHRVEGFSRGMKQRLHLARGLVGDPQVVLLDEPTTGMDPVAAREFRTLVDELRGEGRTVLLTTHDMAEAEAVCDRVTLIDGGRLLATERPATLSRWISTFARVVAREVPAPVAERLVDELAQLPGVAEVHRVPPDGLRVETAAEETAPGVLRALLDAGVTAVATEQPSLEEVYLRVIGDRGMGVRS